jgi:hypothetical protein
MARASICGRSGNNRKSKARTANAAMKTALFHIGKRPNRTPEKNETEQKVGVCARSCQFTFG